MPWTWIRPADAGLLTRRPLLDIGTGDGQTVAALAPSGLVVGVDQSVRVLRSVRGRVAAAQATALPFQDAAFATVLAADLFHHLDNAALVTVAVEVGRVLTSDGRLVAWWWSRPGVSAPDAPRYTRELSQVIDLLRNAKLHAGPVDLISASASGPPTVGVVARRSI